MHGVVIIVIQDLYYMGELCMYYISFRGNVVTLECYEKIIKKDMIDPTNGKKMTEKDLIVLQRVRYTVVFTHMISNYVLEYHFLSVFSFLFFCRDLLGLQGQESP